MSEFFVAADGSDSGTGSEREPFGTVERALRAAREAGGPATVQLRGGRHPLTEPLEIGSGIALQAYAYGTPAQEEPVLSGGRRISGWQVRDGVWVAEVGELVARQLYVDGRRAERAGVDGIPGEVTCTETGYVTDVTLDWRNPGEVEFVHRGVYPWTEARLPVAAVDGGTITMARTAFERANELYHYSWGGHTSRGPGLPTRVENDPSFLTVPGTFALAGGQLHYLPLPGQDPERTQVIAPALEVLAHLRGVTGVALRGLTFAEATWAHPTEHGFLHYHGGGHYQGGEVHRVTLVEGEAWVTVPTNSSAIPACVRIEDSTDIQVEGCRFTRLGATALALTGGADLVVRQCEFDTLSASGITVENSRDAVLEDNRVHRTGLEFSGSPGLSLLGTRDCVLAHNEVSEVPHCGIVAGPAQGTQVLHNLVTDSLRALADGGGVYLSGPQQGGVVRGNVIRDVHTPYNFGLYTDYGAADLVVERNLVQRANSSAVLRVSPPMENVVYRGNFFDADPVGSDDIPPGVRYEDNSTITDPSEIDTATKDIQERAGLLNPR